MFSWWSEPPNGMHGMCSRPRTPPPPQELMEALQYNYTACHVYSRVYINIQPQRDHVVSLCIQGMLLRVVAFDAMVRRTCSLDGVYRPNDPTTKMAPAAATSLWRLSFSISPAAPATSAWTASAAHALARYWDCREYGIDAHNNYAKSTSPIPPPSRGISSFREYSLYHAAKVGQTFMWLCMGHWPCACVCACMRVIDIFDLHLIPYEEDCHI